MINNRDDNYDYNSNTDNYCNNFKLNINDICDLLTVS